jgi:transporter family-2 protein
MQSIDSAARVRRNEPLPAYCPPRSWPIHYLVAFRHRFVAFHALMVHFNGELARYGQSAVFILDCPCHRHGRPPSCCSLCFRARSRGTAAAAGPVRPVLVPIWAASRRGSVMLDLTAVNTPLGLSGTLALGLAGHVAFSLAADRWGMFGLPKRRPDLRDLCALAWACRQRRWIILAAGPWR